MWGEEEEEEEEEGGQPPPWALVGGGAEAGPGSGREIHLPLALTFHTALAWLYVYCLAILLPLLKATYWGDRISKYIVDISMLPEVLGVDPLSFDTYIYLCTQSFN